VDELFSYVGELNCVVNSLFESIFIEQILLECFSVSSLGHFFAEAVGSGAMHFEYFGLLRQNFMFILL